jgi:xanthine dehydrogenase YagS FAD-binding subunit
MRPFSYTRATDLAHAVRVGQNTGQGQVNTPVQFLAGGTTLYDLMKLEVIVPEHLVDLTALSANHAAITPSSEGLRLGAFARMAHVANHSVVQRDYPILAESLQLAASPQLRNMATLGGNVLQRTRCTYFRDPSWESCNKRAPGSGCAALTGFNRNHAVLGTDSSCIAQYPGDWAVALIALDAEIDLTGPNGSRRIPVASLHRAAEGQPHLETNLRSGEVITAFFVPATPWAQRSVYVKVRDRASYEFAIASAAVALQIEGNVVRQVRIGLGGMAYRPWRAHAAEALLVGKSLTVATAAEAGRAAMQGAAGHGHNNYKLALGCQTVVRALMQAKAMPTPNRKA